MYLLILFLPILNFIITILFGRLIGRYYIFIYNIIFSLLVVIISYFAFYEVILLNNECYVNVYNWINISFLNVNCIFLYDCVNIDTWYDEKKSTKNKKSVTDATLLSISLINESLLKFCTALTVTQ